MTIANNNSIYQPKSELDSILLSSPQQPSKIFKMPLQTSQQWRVRGLRGATTVDHNTPELITVAVDQLLTTLEDINSFSPNEIVSVIFSVTQGLDASFPAATARRRPGWEYVPLLDVQQSPVVGSLSHCIRVLIHLNTCLPQQALRHVYLRKAARLRPDLAMINQ